MSGDMTAANGSTSAIALKSTGTPSLKIRSSANADLVKFWDSETAQFYGNVIIGGIQ
jgi:hypothetical protein